MVNKVPLPSVAKRLRWARQVRGLSVRGVARASGVYMRTISYIENGHLYEPFTERGLQRLTAIARTLKIRPEFFLITEDDGVTDQPLIECIRLFHHFDERHKRDMARLHDDFKKIVAV